VVIGKEKYFYFYFPRYKSVVVNGVRSTGKWPSSLRPSLSQRPRLSSLLLLSRSKSMPSKLHRPAALQRRSTSGSNTKLTLGNLNLQKLDSSSNLQLQVALNNATKDVPRGKGKKSGGRPSVRCVSTFQFFRSNPNYPSRFRPDRASCHSNPQVGQKATNKSDRPLNCTCSSSSHTHSARRTVPLARLHLKELTRPPLLDPAKNLALPSLVPSSPLTRSKAKAIRTNGSRARVFP